MDTPDTLQIWSELETTDPRYTKKMTTGAKLTSINGQYQMLRMTQLFGPCGKGWGYELLSSEFIDTGDILSNTPDGNGNIYSLGRGSVNTLRLKLWYIDGGEKYFIEGVGHTPFKYAGMYDGTRVIHVDMEYEKKSMTDAITNAMAKLGMAADVRMGMFDLPDYVRQLTDEVAIEDAVDKEAAAVEQKQEFLVWYSKALELVQTCATINELEKLYKPAAVRVGRQGSNEQIEEFKNAKNFRCRELAPKQGAQK